MDMVLFSLLFQPNILSPTSVQGVCRLGVRDAQVLGAGWWWEVLNSLELGHFLKTNQSSLGRGTKQSEQTLFCKLITDLFYYYKKLFENNHIFFLQNNTA